MPRVCKWFLEQTAPQLPKRLKGRIENDGISCDLSAVHHPLETVEGNCQDPTMFIPVVDQAPVQPVQPVTVPQILELANAGVDGAPRDLLYAMGRQNDKTVPDKGKPTLDWNRVRGPLRTEPKQKLANEILLSMAQGLRETIQPYWG
jgi:hypothetical protein